MYVKMYSSDAQNRKFSYICKYLRYLKNIFNITVDLYNVHDILDEREIKIEIVNSVLLFTKWISKE